MDDPSAPAGPIGEHEALLASERRYRRLFESAKDGILILDAESGKVVDVNPFLLGLLGYPREEILGRRVWELGFFADLLTTEAHFLKLRQGETVRYDDAPLRTAAGGRVEVEFVSNVYLEAGRAVIQCNIRDVTERKLAQAALRLQAAALNAAASPIVITDRDGAIEWVNQAFCDSTGYGAEEAAGKNPRDLVRSGVQEWTFYKELWDTILEGRTWRREVTNRRKDGTNHLEDVTITPVKDARGECSHFVAILRDLTADKELQARLIQSQKMECVGQLAGAVAHDFNNLLTGIHLAAEVALSGLGAGDPVGVELAEILQSAEWAATLTRQLLAFSRREVLKPVVVRLDAVVAEVEPLLRRILGSRVGLAVVAGEDLAWVRADPSQLGQVIMNLVLNARDAMPEGGTVTIETRNVEVGAAEALRSPPLQAGPRVLLSVADTGVGMSPATQARIFEPFFTTKAVGRGTGLGLSTVAGIVESSGGTIAVESAPGSGTTFRILLKTAANASARSPSPSPSPPPSPSLSP